MLYYYCTAAPATESGRLGPTSSQEKGVWVVVGDTSVRLHHHQRDIRDEASNGNINKSNKRPRCRLQHLVAGPLIIPVDASAVIEVIR